MKLYELGTGEPVQVLVKVENASAEYDSTVAFGKEGILLIEPIRYDGKIINFSGDKVHISVIYMEDGIKPLIWVQNADRPGRKRKISCNCMQA